MADYSHATWLIPADADAGWLLNASVATEQVGKLLRIEVPDSAFWDDCIKLRSRGIPYHLWQQGHLGSFPPSLCLWEPGFDFELAVCCDEDGYAAVRVSLHEDGAIKFGALASVLEYLESSRAFAKAHGCEGVDDLGSEYSEVAVSADAIPTT